MFKRQGGGMLRFWEQALSSKLFSLDWSWAEGRPFVCGAWTWGKIGHSAMVTLFARSWTWGIIVFCQHCYINCNNHDNVIDIIIIIFLFWQNYSHLILQRVDIRGGLTLVVRILLPQHLHISKWVLSNIQSAVNISSVISITLFTSTISLVHSQREKIQDYS